MVEEEDPDLLVLQLLAADQLGHVRGVRSREYLDQLAETDRHVGDFLAFLEERGKLEGATVILMADHGQGRGIGGHGHLDWGERPVPFVVWGEGAVPGRHLTRAALGARAGAHDRPRCSACRSPAAARGRPLVPAETRRPAGASARRRRGTRAALPRDRRGPRRGGRHRRRARGPAGARPAGCRWTCCSWTTAPATPPPRSPASTARACTPTRPRAASAPRCARASSSPATRATPPPSTSTATASTTRPTSIACSTRGPRPRRLRARLALPRARARA